MIRTTVPAFVVLAALAGCSPIATPPAPAAPAASTSQAVITPAPSGHKIDLKVTSAKKVSISYGAAGGMSQDEATGTWEKSITSDKSFDFVTLTVTNGDFTSKNDTTCEIIVDGVSKAKQSGTGTAAMASCSVTLSF